MRNAYNKDIRRSIWMGKKRFFAIMLITALGVTMLTGLKAGCVDLRYSADCFLDTQRLFDIQVVSTLGLTEEDIETLAQLSEVEDAEGAYSAKVSAVVHDKSYGASVSTFREQGMNRPALIEGRMPEETDEIAVTEVFTADAGCGIGDVITISEDLDDEEDPVFVNTKYRITAVVLDPRDINNAEGAVVFRTSSTDEYAFFVVPEAVDSEIYTSVYLTLAGARKMHCYSDEYEELTGRVTDLIEAEIKEQRERARYDELTGEAWEELADAEAEVEEELADARRELADAETELADGREALADGEAELADAEREAREGLADARRQIADGYAELNKGKNELEASCRKLEEGEGQIRTAREELAQGEQTAREELARARQELNGGNEQLAENHRQLNAQAQQLAGAFGEYWPTVQWDMYVQALANQQGEAEARDAFVAMLPPGTDMTQIDMLAAGLAQVIGAERDIERQRAELDAQEAAAEAQFAAAWQQIADSEAEISYGKRQLEEGEGAIRYNEEKLKEAEEELAKQEADIRRELADARAEIAKNRKKLADGEEELAEGRKDYEEGKAEAYEELADARKEIEDIDMTQWYVQDRTSLSGYANVESDAKSIEALGTVFPIVFFIVAILISLTTITRMVEEDRGLIGTYKALGFTDHEIRRKYMVYALMASLAGSLLGDVGGFIVLPRILFVIFDTMYLIPEYALQFDAVYGIGGAVLFVGGIAAATAAACEAELSHMPAVLMRPKAPRAGSRVLLERITFLWNRMSFLNKVTARNLFRYKKRLLMTIFGIMGCMALLLFGFAVKDSVTDLMPRQYEQVYRYDVMAVGAATDNEKLLSYLSGDVNVFDYLNVQVESVKLKNAADEEEKVQLFVVPDEADFSGYVRLYNLDYTEAELLPGEVIVTQNAANILDLQEGTAISLQRLNLEQADTAITRVVKNYLGNNIYMTQTTYETLFEEYEPNGALINLSDACADQIAYADALGEREEILSCVSTEKLREEFSGAFALINMVVYIVIVMAACLAAVVLFTLATTNISERGRELATIKVLGFFDREVHLYVNKETLILTAIGILFGNPLGYLFAQTLTYVLNMPAMYLEVSLYPKSYLLASLMSFGFALLVNIITDRSLDAIDPVEALKSVE